MMFQDIYCLLSELCNFAKQVHVLERDEFFFLEPKSLLKCILTTTKANGISTLAECCYQVKRRGQMKGNFNLIMTLNQHLNVIKFYSSENAFGPLSVIFNREQNSAFLFNTGFGSST